MSTDLAPDLVRLARATDYAARQHIAQRRKGERAEPYINHLTEVAALLAEATDGGDVVLLMGGLLHDTLEDTDATYEDLVQRFGADVAALVAEVTDDKSLPKEERKRLQIEKTAGKSRTRETAEACRQDVQPSQPGGEPADGMVAGTAARLCRVGARCRTLVSWAQSAAGSCVRRGP